MMETAWWWRNLITTLSLPPANLLVVAGISYLALRRYPRLGRVCLGLSLLGLWLLSSKAVGTYLLQQGALPPVLSPQHIQTLPLAQRPQAIVVLGGGRRFGALEVQGTDGEDVSPPTLERLRYAAQWGQASGLPVLVTGGKPDGGQWSEAALMARVLEKELKQPVRWQEAASNTTRENATLSAPLLRAAGVSRIVLISHGWHLPRATALFTEQGLVVYPAPCGLMREPEQTLLDWLPSAEGMLRSRLALREWLGRWQDAWRRRLATP